MDVSRLTATPGWRMRNCATLANRTECAEAGGQLTLSKSGPERCFAGGTCTFKITLTNSGHEVFDGKVAFADNMQIAAALKSFGARIESIRPALGCSPAPSALPFLCQAHLTLPPGGIRTFSITVRLSVSPMPPRPLPASNCFVAIDPFLVPANVSPRVEGLVRRHPAAQRGAAPRRRLQSVSGEPRRRCRRRRRRGSRGQPAPPRQPPEAAAEEGAASGASQRMPRRFLPGRQVVHAGDHRRLSRRHLPRPAVGRMSRRDLRGWRRLLPRSTRRTTRRSRKIRTSRRSTSRKGTRTSRTFRRSPSDDPADNEPPWDPDDPPPEEDPYDEQPDEPIDEGPDDYDSADDGDWGDNDDED